jgi:hypothetical protein
MWWKNEIRSQSYESDKQFKKEPTHIMILRSLRRKWKNYSRAIGPKKDAT